MANNLPPIPQDDIEENFKWRDWFRTLRSYVLASNNFGCFYNTTNQTFAAANTAYRVTLNTQDGHNGITLSDSKMTVETAGTYNIQYSLQVSNTSTSNIGTIYVWFRKNGTDVVASNSKFSVVTSHGGTDGYLIALSNLIVDLAANDYVEVMTSVDHTTVFLEAYTATSTPTKPSIPSSIVTINQLS